MEATIQEAANEVSDRISTLQILIKNEAYELAARKAKYLVKASESLTEILNSKS